MGLREPLKLIAEDCGLPVALEAMGERWSFMILRAAFNRIYHFEEFQSELGIARNILANRLSRLVDHGILMRNPCPDDRRKIEYRLTEKGLALLPAMIALRQWGELWSTSATISPFVRSRSARMTIACSVRRICAGAMPRKCARWRAKRKPRQPNRSGCPVPGLHYRRERRRCAPADAGALAVRSAVVIGAEILVARRRGGGEAERLCRLAERADLIRDIVVVDLHALQVRNHGFAQFGGVDGLVRDLAQRDDRVLVTIAIDGQFRTARDLPSALRSEQHQIEPVGNLVDTIFDGYARHKSLHEILEYRKGGDVAIVAFNVKEMPLFPCPARHGDP
jgi:DNA-binding HxlR family transcriptional regulator